MSSPRKLSQKEANKHHFNTFQQRAVCLLLRRGKRRNDRYKNITENVLKLGTAFYSSFMYGVTIVLTAFFCQTVHLVQLLDFYREVVSRSVTMLSVWNNKQYIIMPARQCIKDFKKPMNYRLKYTMHYLPGENTAKSMTFTLFQITTLRLMLQLHRVSH